MSDTTETLPAVDPATLPALPPSVVPATSADGPLTTTAGYQLGYALARRFAESNLVPQHLRGKPADCFVAICMARELGDSPIIVMQSIYFISGKAGWSASYVIARANRSGVFRGPINWRISGSGDTLTATAYARLSATDEEVSISVGMPMAKAEGWTSNKKYQTMPELMLRYRSATMLVRLYAPEVMLGYHTADELEDVAASRPQRRAGSDVLDVVVDPPTREREPGEEG